MINLKKRNRKRFARAAHLERGAYTYNLEHTLDYFKQKHESERTTITKSARESDTGHDL